MSSPSEREAELLAEIRKLKQLVETLSADIGVLTRIAIRPWGLTPQEFAIVCCLAKHDLASNELLLKALAACARSSFRDPKIVTVLVCRIRKKIAPHGFKIETVYGAGYQLCAAGREAVASVVGGVR